MRLVYLAAGHASLALGILGIPLPVLPSTPFLLLAVYFYSKSSSRLHDWIVAHPRLGRPIRDWRERGCIRPRAKFVASALIAVSFGVTFRWGGLSLASQALLGIVALALVAFLLTRPSR